MIGWGLLLLVLGAGQEPRSADEFSLPAAPPPARQAREVRVGSKKFTESVILGEVVRQLLVSDGFAARHVSELGGTRILFEALKADELDAYVEYTGTLREEIYAGEDVRTDAALEAALERDGLAVLATLGFDNTYALAVREPQGARLGLTRVSQLAGHPELRYGVGHEFLERSDGWPGLAARYALVPESIAGLDHDLAYRALVAGDIDVMDVYTTDADVAHYGLRVLEDDRAYFPSYAAVLLARADLETRAPGANAVLARLEGRIDEARMMALNARASVDDLAEDAVAAEFLGAAFGLEGDARATTLAGRLWRSTGEHLFLVGTSLLAALLVGLPLGVFAARRRRIGRIVLGAVGVLQTIPSLAMFVFLIAPLGIGAQPAIVVLFLYSLLPIVRGTHAGLRSVPAPLIESARALGLSDRARLRLVELPLALRSILAGVQTSAVICVGTATIAAFIGANGYGKAILSGIRRDDIGQIMEGAVPAAILALAVQGAFDLAERGLLSPGLRAAGEQPE